MKKTLLLLLFVCGIQLGLAQTLTYSESQTITPDNSLACEQFTGIIENTTFYREFNLDDFGITSGYNITSIDFGVEKLVNAPAAGYPVTVQLYSHVGNFPSGNLTLLAEESVILQDNATGTIINVPITAAIPANDNFIVAINAPSSIDVSGANDITFQIGSNDLGETKDGTRNFSYFSSTVCSGYQDIATFQERGWNDVHLIMNVNGNSATASTGDLDLVSFNYYPNPVKDKLNMTAQEEISSVEIYNVLGQQIKTIQPSSLQASLDLASLSTGTYMVRAKVNDKVGSFKVVKE